MQAPDGKTAKVEIVGFTDKIVRVDANHPLSGKDLIFEVELVAIVAPS